MKMKKTITKTTLILLLATLLCIGCVTYVYAAVGNAFDAPTCYCGGSTSHIGHGSSEQSWTAGSSIDYCSYTATVHYQCRYVCNTCGYERMGNCMTSSTIVPHDWGLRYHESGYMNYCFTCHKFATDFPDYEG